MLRKQVFQRIVASLQDSGLAGAVQFDHLGTQPGNLKDHGGTGIGVASDDPDPVAFAGQQTLWRPYSFGLVSRNPALAISNPVVTATRRPSGTVEARKASPIIAN